MTYICEECEQENTIEDIVCTSKGIDGDIVGCMFCNASYRIVLYKIED